MVPKMTDFGLKWGKARFRRYTPTRNLPVHPLVSDPLRIKICRGVDGMQIFSGLVMMLLAVRLSL